MIYLAVYEMDPAELAILDQAEGVGNGYQHYELTLPRFGKTLSYLGQESHIDEQLRPYQWYKEYVLAGAVFHEFDRVYRQAIRHQSHWDDPDPERHKRHMRRISQLQSTPGLEE